MDTVQDTQSQKKAHYEALQEGYITIVKTIADVRQKGIYLINVQTNKIIFASDHPLLLCGLSKEQVLFHDIRCFLPIIHPQDVSMLTDIITSLSNNHRLATSGLRRRATLHITFRVRNEHGFSLVTHTISLLHTDYTDQPQIVIGLVTPAIHHQTGIAVIRMTDSDHTYLFHYHHDTRQWHRHLQESLSINERQTLILSARGLSVDNISKHLCKSVETIKKYRHNILTNLNAQNMTEAISRAIHYCLL